MARYVRLLKPEKTPPMLVWVSEYVHGIFADCHILFDLHPQERRHEGGAEWVWRELDGGDAIIRYVEDYEAKFEMLVVTSADDKKAFSIVDAFDLVLQSFSVAELLDAARRPADEPGALTRLALGLNHREDPAATAAIAEGLAHASGAVRMDAALAATLLKSPALCDSLERALAGASDDEERRALEHARAQCTRSTS